MTFFGKGFPKKCQNWDLFPPKIREGNVDTTENTSLYAIKITFGSVPLA